MGNDRSTDRTGDAARRAEVEAAWSAYKLLAIDSPDPGALAELFTEDARFEDRYRGAIVGRAAIARHLASVREECPAMTYWIEWEIVDGDRVAFYRWHNLPDPAGGGARFAYPSTTFLEYAGDGKFRHEADYYNPGGVERTVDEWTAAGGNKSTEPDPTLRGIDGWAPDPRTPTYPREEVEAAFANYRERASIAVATGDWDQWADMFADDAHYREHSFGYFRSQQEIREWITAIPFATMYYPVPYYLIDGNRLSALIPNVLPAPDGSDVYFGFDNNTILHYAGNGQWSYEEDVYSMREAEHAITSWVAAGGVLSMSVEDALRLNEPLP